METYDIFATAWSFIHYAPTISAIALIILTLFTILNSILMIVILCKMPSKRWYKKCEKRKKEEQHFKDIDEFYTIK